MFRSIACGFVFLFVVCAVSPTRAQDSGAPPPNYQPVLDEAIREFALGNYMESLTLFSEAHKLWPNARAARAIGRCHYELGDYVAANKALEDALSTGVRPLDASQRPETEKLLQRVREHLARYTIVTEPTSAQLRVDGVAVTLDNARSIVLPVGIHALEVSATGFMSAQRELTVESQRDEQLQFTLVPLEAAEEVVSAPVEPAEPLSRADQPLRKKWWLWTSVAGAVAVAAVATVLIVGHDKPDPDRPSGGTSGIAIGVPTAANP